MLDVNAYLARIGYTSSTEPTPETLRNIHLAHMLTVPFENLDIGRRRIVLDGDSLIRKIVEEKRGGFCYELNGAFAALLTQLGFHVTLLSARVARPDGSEGPEFDHLALRVDLDEPWLADVGFGDSFLEPLRLNPGLAQQQGRRIFRLRATGNRFQLEHKDLHADSTLDHKDQDAASTREHKDPEADWTKNYSFGLQAQQLEDFSEMCHYHQTSPKSHFTEKRICSLAREDGRITLSDSRFTTRQGEIQDERILTSAEEWRDTLKRFFGVAIDT
jgi:N-hydroxyarylamine O-acetyltransferase